jgi:hypothetical protein
MHSVLFIILPYLLEQFMNFVYTVFDFSTAQFCKSDLHKTGQVPNY